MSLWLVEVGWIQDVCERFTMFCQMLTLPLDLLTEIIQ